MSAIELHRPTSTHDVCVRAARGAAAGLYENDIAERA